MLFRLDSASGSTGRAQFEAIGAHKIAESETYFQPHPVWGIELTTLEELFEFIKRYDYGKNNGPEIVISLPTDRYPWHDRTIKIPEITFYDSELE